MYGSKNELFSKIQSIIQVRQKCTKNALNSKNNILIKGYQLIIKP